MAPYMASLGSNARLAAGRVVPGLPRHAIDADKALVRRLRMAISHVT